MILCCGPLTTAGDKQIFLIEQGNAVFSKKIPREKDLLATLEPLVKKHHATLQGFCALVGNGTFSAVRETVTILNGLAMAHNMPAKSVTLDPLKLEKDQKGTIKSIEVAYNASQETFAKPEYSAPPTITTPKKKPL